MNIFTYGSLMFPPVWEKVTGCPAAGKPARLAGFSARRICDQSYPALVEEAGSVVDGIVYEDVSAAAVKRLDDFEGEFYRRIEVRLETAPSILTTAWVYLAAKADDPVILTETWDAALFEKESLNSFLTNDPGFTGGGRQSP